MIKRLGIIAWLMVLNYTIDAQQITQQFTFTESDVIKSKMGGVYDVIGLPETEYPNNPDGAGNPQLPIKTFAMLLPQGALPSHVTITVNSEQQLAGNFYLYPQQPPVFIGDQNPPLFVEPNNTIYGSNNPYPEQSLQQYSTCGYRDYNYVTVSFIPFRYVPADRKLFLLSKITVTINYARGENTQTYKYRPYTEIDDEAYETVKERVLNAKQIDAFYPETAAKIAELRKEARNPLNSVAFQPTELPALEGSPVFYVIITNNTDIYGNNIGNFVEKFQQFADWKTRTGMLAKVITVDAIREAYQGVDIAEQIRQFIKDAHRYWGTEYVLLGGGAHIVPVRLIYKNAPTDLYYSAIWHARMGYNDNWNFNGDFIFAKNVENDQGPDYADFLPDIAVGRAPVDTEAELDLFLVKNFTYARNSMAPSLPGRQWLNKQLNIGGIVFRYPWPENGVGTNGLALPLFWYIENSFSQHSEQYTMLEFENPPTYDTWWQAYHVMDVPVTHSQVIYQMNTKPGIIFHLDHSSPNSLGLTGIIGTTQSIQSSDILGLAQSNQYPILFAGGCKTAPINMDSYIGEKWITSTGGGVAFIGTTAGVEAEQSYQFYKSLFSKLYTENNVRIGRLVNSSANSEAYRHKIFNLLGDPELSIYTSEPTYMDVRQQYNATTGVTTGGSIFSVTVSNIPAGKKAKVCLYKENEVFAYGLFNNGQTGEFYILPNTTGQLHLTVTCNNAEPFETVINVTQGSAAHLYKSNITIYDENGNGIIEPGENVEFTVELTNSGMQTATSVSANLYFDNTVQVLQNTATFNDIASGQTQVSQQRFKFKAPEHNYMNGQAITCALTITTDQGTFVDDFVLNLKGSRLDIGNRTALVNGMETNIFYTNDIVDIFINFHNYGTVLAQGLTATLTTQLPSNVVTILNNNEVYGSIAPFAQATNSNPFKIRIGTAYARQDLLFEIALTDAFGITKYFTLNLRETAPSQISEFAFSSGKAHITINWSVLTNVKGYNIYRSESETGSFAKVNKFLVTGISMYYDADVQEMHTYFYKVSPISLSGKENSLTTLSSYKAWTSLEQHAMFPVGPDANSGAFSSPIIFDANLNGKQEIFVNCNYSPKGVIVAFDQEGNELFDIDHNPTSKSGFAITEHQLFASPAIGDINNDGIAEVFALTRNPGVLYGYTCIDGDSDDHPDKLWDNGFIHLGNGDWGFRSPVLADINNDGFLEIIILSEQQILMVFDRNANLLFSETIGNSWYSMGEIAVGDIDGDGYKEIVAGMYSVNSNQQGGIIVWKFDGQNFTSSAFATFAPQVRADNGPVLVDLDGDGKLDILIITRNDSHPVYPTGAIYAFRHDGNPVNHAWSGTYTFNLYYDSYATYITPRIAVGDLNLDGVPEVVFACGYHLHVLDNVGNQVQGFPVLNIGDSRDRAPILADIDNDPFVEIIMNVGSGVINAYKYNGQACTGWNLRSPEGSFVGSPAVADIDGDGKNEVVAVCGISAKTFVWKTAGDADKIEWGSYRFNAQNTGVYESRCRYSASNNIELNNSAVEIWTANRVLNGDIIINQGAKLTVKSTLFFVNEAKIIIKPGGRLILDGAKLTNSCGSQWQGIHLHGTPAVQQNTINQPVVELKNGAIIENAVHGVYAGDPTNPGTKGGGIVYANGATFRNCGTGIYLESYRNIVQGTTTELNNLSHVTKCTFETTADYLTLSNVAPVGVYLWGVKGIYIRGNSFVNHDFAAFENTKRGIGVSVSGASCSIKFYCNDLDCMDIVKNSFNNLTIGVCIASSATLSDVTIEDNLFTNNLMAFTASGSYTGQAFFNNIHLGSQGQYGFYVFNNNNFKIEENTVVGNYTGFGVAYDGSTVANELYKNNFSKLAYGVWARNNPNLKLTCNTFNDNTQQVYSTNNGISRFQGSSQTPAGNIFLPECSNSDREIKAVSQSLSISYYYKSGDASQQPLCVTSNFRRYSTANQNLCPTRHEGGGGPTEDLLLSVKTTMEGQEAELQSVVDGGNTDKTIHAIETVREGEEISLMSDLLDKSPFLSETALVKTATEVEVLPEIVIANVLVANPQAAKSVEVQTALDNRPVPMPDYLRNAINEGLDMVSEKEVLERNLAETTLEKEQLLSGLIHLYKTDETTDRSAQTEALLLAENTLEYDYLAVENYLATERFEEAQQLFNALPVKYTLNEARQAEYDAMEQIVTLLSVLNSNNYFLLNQEQKAELYTLAEDGQNRATMLARGILTLVDGASFAVPEIVIEETEGENKNQRIPTEQKPVFSFTVQPNPANDYFVVEYNLATKDFETAELRLFNNAGKQVYQQKLTKQAFQLLITTEQFEPGIYLCRLYKDNKEIVETQYFASVLVIKPSQLTDPQAVEQSGQLLEGQQFFLVYPNPTTVDVTVCSSRTENCTIEVYDERGQVVNRLTKVSATNTINTRGLKPGVYHVRLVENGMVVETVKLVVQ